MVQDVVNINYPTIKRVLLRAEDKDFTAKLYDNFMQSTALILVLSEGTLENENCIKAILLAIVQNKKIILVHDTTSDFPQYSAIEKLPKEVQPIFSSIAVPLVAEHLHSCWDKISDKIFDRIKVRKYVKYGF